MMLHAEDKPLCPMASPSMGYRGASPLDFQLVIFEWSCTSDSHRFLQ